jgi:hypothetical protein
VFVRFRPICLLCALLLLSLAALPAFAEDGIRGYDRRNGWVYVTLGEFPQDADGGIRPILWRVLSVEDGRAYCVSEYVLINHRIHGDDQEYIAFKGDFRQTEMWDYLNGEFSGTAFTEAELEAIDDTEEFGRIFLLSREDLKNESFGFTSNQRRKAWGTPWALAQMTENEAHNNRVEQALFRYGAKYGSHSPYWTRTQGSNKYSANCTKQEGQIGWIRVVVQNEGCRPACWLRLDALTVSGGAGTLEDPFVLIPSAEVEAVEILPEGDAMP